jgi:hypothetical protein
MLNGRGIMGDTAERFNMGTDPLGVAMAREYGSMGHQANAYGHAGMGVSNMQRQEYSDSRTHA